MRRSKDLIGKLYHCIGRMDSEDRETRVKALTHLEELNAHVKELEQKVYDCGVGRAINQARIAKAMSHAYWSAHVKNTNSSLTVGEMHEMANMMAEKHWEDWMESAKHWMQIIL
jgi:hypothetical protein